MSLKLVPAALLLFVAVATAGGLSQLRSASAGPTGAPFVGPTQVFVGETTGVSATWGPDENGNAVIAATSNIGVFITAAPATNEVGQIAGLGTSVLTITDDADAVADAVTTVNAVFRCSAPGTTTFTISHQGTTSAESQTLTCLTASGGGGGGAGSGGQVAATATPNMLPCEGGTSTIHAEVVDDFGNIFADAAFRFETTAGSLVQTNDRTARLTLGPNQTVATVTAKIFQADDPSTPEIDPSVLTATVEVFLACNGTTLTQTLVVTASPNVIDCTGTTTITASVRDVNGHVVPGRGFHFVTSAGLLTVEPNNANTEAGVATLKLRPGDGDATVAVSSGLNIGTFEELDTTAEGVSFGNEPNFVVDETDMVTVKQNCLSTTTGQIKVNSSAKTVTCGQSVFIGLSVIDEDIQTVIDNTPMTLIASAGGFYGGEGILLSAAQVPTSHGEANTIYYAPANFNGEVKITAASGDAYGYQTLNITCIVAPLTGTGTTTGSGTGSAVPAQPCVSIGDGVFINPNTGAPCNPNAITPPNTGSAGLK